VTPILGGAGSKILRFGAVDGSPELGSTLEVYFFPFEVFEAFEFSLPSTLLGRVPLREKPTKRR
jgi:hypothetical protein